MDEITRLTLRVIELERLVIGLEKKLSGYDASFANQHGRIEVNDARLTSVLKEIEALKAELDAAMKPRPVLKPIIQPVIPKPEVKVTHTPWFRKAFHRLEKPPV